MPKVFIIKFLIRSNLLNTFEWLIDPNNINVTTNVR
jgi:hypothetical protein